VQKPSSIGKRLAVKDRFHLRICRSPPAPPPPAALVSVRLRAVNAEECRSKAGSSRFVSAFLARPSVLFVTQRNRRRRQTFCGIPLRSISRQLQEFMHDYRFARLTYTRCLLYRPQAVITPAEAVSVAWNPWAHLTSQTIESERSDSQSLGRSTLHLVKEVQLRHWPQDGYLARQERSLLPIRIWQNPT